ncbi:hypothetical protein I0D00_01715 [Pseudomonas lalucatii]|uniref:Uncharacterized protein n=1 Tax=Pseudomonas lalucatii TaxID=1424203 RepID=A0ABS5PWB2_9PSED|nr:hypothetical protein [Pseudomonas lalucatii]MBS7660669.1 hypothetical protein [Pseudomonas lalucatii]MBS7724520.1 hypothetical protein [Pseudomonas lalucatii]QVM87484.1 hypothetical protein I0D68_20695 [Pseudomonas lalucatii]
MQALRLLFDAADAQFDEEVVLAFIPLVGTFAPGECVERNGGEVAIITRLLRVLDSSKKPCKPTAKESL